MIRLFLLIVGLVLLALLGLNVALTIGAITRHPSEWLGAALFFCWASTLPIPDYDRRGRRVVREEP